MQRKFSARNRFVHSKLSSWTAPKLKRSSHSPFYKTQYLVTHVVELRFMFRCRLNLSNGGKSVLLAIALRFRVASVKSIECFINRLRWTFILETNRRDINGRKAWKRVRRFIEKPTSWNRAKQLVVDYHVFIIKLVLFSNFVSLSNSKLITERSSQWVSERPQDNQAASQVERSARSLAVSCIRSKESGIEENRKLKRAATKKRRNIKGFHVGFLFVSFDLQLLIEG